jgi:hypothetical protein
MSLEINLTARLATLAKLREHLQNIITPVPSNDALRDLFDRERVPRYKASPDAKRGGGPVYYSVPAVEKLFQKRLVAIPLP